MTNVRSLPAHWPGEGLGLRLRLGCLDVDLLAFVVFVIFS